MLVSVDWEHHLLDKGATIPREKHLLARFKATFQYKSGTETIAVCDSMKQKSFQRQNEIWKDQFGGAVALKS